MRVPLFDLEAYHRTIRNDVLSSISRVYDSGVFLNGPESQHLERELGSWLDSPHVVSVSSGTDALICGLMALGVGCGARVVTTPFSFFATAEAVLRVGARLAFADIEVDGFGLDPVALEHAFAPAPAAVIAVHLFGQACAIDEIRVVCERAGSALVEDTAQAFGSRLRDRSLGTFGAAGCFSFFPGKVLGALGDGGALALQDGALAERACRLRGHGARAKHEHAEVGGNFRMDELQASVLRVKLGQLTERQRANQRLAQAYERALSDVGEIVLPDLRRTEKSAWLPFTIRVLERRDDLRRFLLRQGIATQVHYPRPLHLQPAFEGLGFRAGQFPNAERRAGEALAIPLFSELSEPQLQHVVRQIRAFFGYTTNDLEPTP